MAAAAAVTGRKPGQEIKRVELDVLVAMQIMKHCTQMAPHPVTGTLLGLDVHDTLQITHSFAHLSKDSEEVSKDGVDAGSQYQVDMLKRLRDVNVDSNTAGWYQTTHLGQFFSDTVIATQCEYQSEIESSILLVYDPLQSAVGRPAFKALRLRPDFMAKYLESQKVNLEALKDTASRDMFVEIPIVVQSPAVVDNFLQTWAAEDPGVVTSQIDTLDVENQAFSEKNVQLLIGSLTNLAEEQQKIQMYERSKMNGKGDKGKGKGKGKGKFGPPRQLDTMILSQQINAYCKQVNGIASDAFGKIFLLSNKPTAAGGA